MQLAYAPLVLILVGLAAYTTPAPTSVPGCGS